MEEQLSEECPVLDIPPQMAPEAAEPRLLSDGSATHSEEEVALLPRNTKVIVTGNNRTKQSLIGLNGVVTKAVGLGGWHWLVLSTGEEVKLQRNALHVVEFGPEETEEFTEPENESTYNNQQEDFFARTRIRRPSKLLAAMSAELPASTKRSNNTMKPQPLHHAHSAPTPTSHHAAAAAAVAATNGGAFTCSTNYATPRLNFYKMDIGALRRYRRHYRLPEVGPNSSREELVSAVRKHWGSQQVDEASVVASFMAAVKRRHDNGYHFPY